jgi:CDP-paratose 2-epimerase
MKIIVTGAAGFVGTNLSLKLSSMNEEVLLLDDLSRPFVNQNRNFLEKNTDYKIELVDITDTKALFSSFENFGDPDVVINLAGQVSLLASIQDPIRDFNVNAMAPLVMLDYFRKNSLNPVFINLSSNKVYGDLKSFRITEGLKRYECEVADFDETIGLDFYGPYGCSKGSADQYMIDYARIFGMRTVSFRQSTIYGPFQRPTSDQGWVVYMIDQILSGEPIHLNGIGKQVRDILYVEDLVDLLIKIPTIANFPFGKAFNVGGGLSNSLSILELFDLIRDYTGKTPEFTFGEERPGDQKYYVSDLTKINKVTGWKPFTSKFDGIQKVILSRQDIGNIE